MEEFKRQRQNGNDRDLFGDASGRGTFGWRSFSYASYPLYGELGFQGSFCPHAGASLCSLPLSWELRRLHMNGWVLPPSILWRGSRRAV